MKALLILMSTVVFEAAFVRVSVGDDGPGGDTECSSRSVLTTQHHGFRNHLGSVLKSLNIDQSQSWGDVETQLRALEPVQIHVAVSGLDVTLNPRLGTRLRQRSGRRRALPARLGIDSHVSRRQISMQLQEIARGTIPNGPQGLGVDVCQSEVNRDSAKKTGPGN